VTASHDPGPETLAPASAGPAGVAPRSDVLSDVLRAVRLTGSLFFQVEASSPWVSEAPDSTALAPVLMPGAGHVVSYHLMMEGQCWCEMRGQAPVLLSAGDVAVIPHGDAYALSSTPGMLGTCAPEELLDWYRMAAHQRPCFLREGGGEAERRRLLCGFLGCEVVPFNPVLATLPRLLHVRRPGGEPGDRLGHLIEFAAAEVREPRAGRDCVLLRISELLFVEVVRRHLASLPAEQSGWLAALADPVVGRALTILHEQPAQPWTVEELARRAGLGRSALAERFVALVGQPPMQYLTRWRMQLAADLLADGQSKVSAVALQVGYDSEAAFSRAFKALVGVPPARWRQQRARRQVVGMTRSDSSS
jgi:AraC-like DNA-binding protein